MNRALFAVGVLVLIIVVRIGWTVETMAEAIEKTPEFSGQQFTGDGVTTKRLHGESFENWHDQHVKAVLVFKEDGE